jgi:hypothetical protein
MSKRINYFDNEAGRLCDASGGANFVPPVLLYQDKPTWEIDVVTLSAGASPAAVDLSAYIAWEFAVDDDADHATDPWCRTLNANIDSSDAATGKIVIKIDADTAEFDAGIGSSWSKGVYGRLKGTAADGTKISFVFSILAFNDPDPNSGDPGDPPSNYYTIAETIAGFQALTLVTQLSLPAGATAIALGASATYRAVQIKGAIDDGSKYTVIEGDIIHNGSTATPYVDMRGDVLDDLTIAADISGGQIRLILTNTGAAKKLVYGIQDLIGVSA